MRTRWRVISTMAWFVASLLLLAGPGFARWGNHATPRVLGLPWSHAWVWGIVVANFVVLVVLHTSRWLDEALDGSRELEDPLERDNHEPQIGRDGDVADAGHVRQVQRHPSGSPGSEIARR